MILYLPEEVTSSVTEVLRESVGYAAGESLFNTGACVCDRLLFCFLRTDSEGERADFLFDGTVMFEIFLFFIL